MKTCTRCKVEQPFNEFYKDTGKKDGLRSLCKKCTRKSQAEYHKNNAEKIKERQRRWSQQNTEKIKEYHRRLYKSNPEKRKEQVKEWRKNNPEKVNKAARERYKNNPKVREHKLQYGRTHRDQNTKRGREWRKNNREKFLINSREQVARRRARKENNGVFVVLKKELLKIYLSPCFACGSTENLTQDHIIPISRGGRHSIGNLMPLCHSCNASKNSKTWMEWRLAQTRNALVE